MKTKLIMGFIFIIVAVLAGWNVVNNQSEIELSELAKVNVEAFANYEGGDDVKLPCTKDDDSRCTVTFRLESGEISTQKIPDCKNT